MTAKEFKKLINGIPEDWDGEIILLPEGFHSSRNIHLEYEEAQDEDGIIKSILIRCE